VADEDAGLLGEFAAGGLGEGFAGVGCAARQLSGSPGALLRRGPLRTVLAALTAHGSSKP
jgi:hypothetical protein